MSKGAIVTTFSQTEDVTVANTTLQTTIAGAGLGSLVLPPNFLEVGTSLRILARGTWANVSTPTREWKVKLGPSVIVGTGANATPKDLPSEPWALEVILVCRTIGKTGSIVGAGSVSSVSLHRDFTPQTPVAVDTTKPQTLDLTCKWGTANAGNTVTCTHLLVWSEQPV